MSGDKRREKIIDIIRQSDKPVSGTKLANEFGISRQVIVQDIAILRAADNIIISTNRGYIIQGENNFTRVLKLTHTDKEIETELNTVVDLGGKVIDVFVKHKVYGVISAQLDINSRRDVKLLLQDINDGKSAPLKNITSNYHYHTIAAKSKEELDLIEEELKQKGFLIEK